MFIPDLRTRNSIDSIVSGDISHDLSVYRSCAGSVCPGEVTGATE